jgi:hypothetical protein
VARWAACHISLPRAYIHQLLDAAEGGDMNFGRIVGTIVALVMLFAAGLFFMFRSTFATGDLQQVQTAVGIEAPRPERHIVPEGFRGWTRVDYGVEGAPPLDVEDDAAIFEYPESGHLETSTPAPDTDGLLHKHYFEQRGAELVSLSRLSQIWGEYTLRAIEDDGSSSRSFGFFIGTIGEFRASKKPLPGLVPLDG